MPWILSGTVLYHLTGRIGTYNLFKLDLTVCIQRGALNKYYPLCMEALVHVKVKGKVI